MEDLPRALLTVMGGIVMLFIIVLSVGIALDMFTYEFLTLGSDISPDFSIVSDSLQNLTVMFYFIPLLGVVLFAVYLAKWIIRKHWYSKQEEEYYVEEL